MKTFKIDVSSRIPCELYETIYPLVLEAEKIISEKMVLRFTPLSKKTRILLKQSKENSNLREGLCTKESLGLSINNLVHGSICNLRISSADGLIAINIERRNSNSIVLYLTCTQQILKEIILNRIILDLDGKYLLNAVLPDEISIVEFTCTDTAKFLEEYYFEATLYDNTQLKDLYQGEDIQFLRENSAQDDRIIFLENVKFKEEAFIVYESDKSADEKIFKKSFYDSGELVQTSNGFIRIDKDRKSVLHLLECAQKEEVQNLRLIFPKNNKVATFDSQGYWIFCI